MTSPAHPASQSDKGYLMHEATITLSEKQLLSFSTWAIGNETESEDNKWGVFASLVRNGGEKGQRVIAELIRNHPNEEVRSFGREVIEKGYWARP